MKILKSIALILGLHLILLSPSWGQNPILTFDGVDDYIDLGTSIGNGVRTIEMWYRPANQIDSSNTDFITLVARNNGATINENEFSISFSPLAGSEGKLLFVIEDAAGNPSLIFSDSSSWNAKQWYHVAAVINPNQGMMMFIDGIKQADTASYSAATGTINKLTAIGTWGDEFIRNFNGSIDDVRLSSSAIYTTNFTPPCPNILATASTLGLWNLNEASGNVAIDSSSNSYNGQIYGASWDTATICVDTSTVNILDFNVPFGDIIKVYPNPSKVNFHFEYENANKLNLNLIIYNSFGQQILIKEDIKTSIEIMLEKEASGVYYYHLTDGDAVRFSGTLIKE